MESILTSIKQLLGLTAEYDYFDPDIITHINTAIMSLTQIGVGPSEGFIIEDETVTWKDFIPDATPVRVEWIKTYVYLKVRLVFDPPTNSSIIQSINEQIKELEWRLNFAAESGV